MDNNIFSVTKEQLSNLDPYRAVELFSQLIWAEATTIGLQKNFIDIPSAITVADGGIDAEVYNANVSGGEGLIKAGLTRYQIKTGPFDLSRLMHINEILLNAKQNQLKTRIKSCFEKKGTLIIVLFGWDNPEPIDDKIINQFKNVILKVEPDYSDVKIEICKQNNIISYIQNFPSIALQLKSISDQHFKTHSSWAQNDDMKKQLVKSSEFDNLLESARSLLRSIEKAPHLRFLDLAGSGKTRFVFEVTNTLDLSPLVIYSKAQNFVNSNLLNIITLANNNSKVILVIDECNYQQKIDIWNQLKHQSARIKLITIYNENETKAFDILYPKIPQLSSKEIKTIINSYNVPKDKVERYYDLAGNSPRFAHMIGSNLKHFPDDILNPIENIYTRIIAGYDDPQSELVQKRHRVLRYLALFKRFGYRQPCETEFEVIFNKIKDDCDISKAELIEIVEKLRSLNILQGDVTLYITPPALHIKMWSEWWSIYRRTFNIDDFLKDIPENSELRLWFYEMFKYAEESNTTSRIVKELLNDVAGPFLKKNYLDTELGSRFFLALSEADPKSSLLCLSNTIAKWDKEKLLNYKEGRRNIIWALEKIVVWKDLFNEGARILLKLAEAENENYSNNATGIFISLFTSAYGHGAPTECSPQDRLPLLFEILNSPLKELREIGYEACDAALNARKTFRIIGAEFQGLRKEPQLWQPNTWDEVFEYYRNVWNALKNKINLIVDKDETQIVIRILQNNARSLIINPNLSKMIIDTLSELAINEGIDKKELLSTIIRILHYERKNISGELIKELEQLKEFITGIDFSSLLKRYVGMQLIEDEFDESGERIDAVEKRISEMAKLSLENPNELKKELYWLVTEDAHNGYTFGYQLGTHDEHFDFLDSILNTFIESKERGTIFFLGGYFCAIFNRDITRWEDELDRLSKNPFFEKHIIEITRRSGLTDRAVHRSIRLAKVDLNLIKELKSFAYGSISNNVSASSINELCEFISNSKISEAGSITVTILNHYYLRKEKIDSLPEELVFKVLTHNSFLTSYPPPFHDTMDEYYWTKLGMAFLKKYSHHSLELAEIIIKYFGIEGTLFRNSFSRCEEVLNFIASNNPNEVWEIISQNIGPPIDSRAHALYNWLRGGEFYNEPSGALKYFQLDKILKWVNENIESRAWYLAYFVPPSLFVKENEICFVREVLINFGEREDVRNNLIANFSTEGWTGPSSIHYIEKRKYLEQFKMNESHINVIKWINEYIEELDARIENAKIEEERRGY